ncbi:MAG TPA: aldo/keto reductase, partial [Caulobacteraceae bacterium]|nr:aldo/keto reductase [Caulobacteraceae bacterium]
MALSPPCDAYALLVHERGPVRKASISNGLRQDRHRMQRQELGRSGLMVAPWAFGGNVFDWTADERTSFALLDAFVDHGFNLVDTADVYSFWV